MLVKTQGVVLHSIKYGDNARIVRVFTRDQGLTSFLVRAIHGKKSSKAAQYQPLCVLDIEADIRDQRSLQTIKESRLRPGSGVFLTDPMRSAVAMFIAEVFLRSQDEGEVSIELFDFLIESIDQVSDTHDLSGLPILFTLELAEMLGIYPDLESQGQFLDLREGEFSERRPHHDQYIDGEEAHFLRTHHGMGFVASGARMNRGLRRRLIEVLLDYFRIHIPHFQEVKSYHVFKEIL